MNSVLSISFNTPDCLIVTIGTVCENQDTSGDEQLTGGSRLTYQWQRTNDGVNWTDIGSFDRYTTTGADQGYTFRVHVTAQ
ncbi:hypothetical protein JD545_20960 [Aeromonas veronii]|nr:hypothetical protein [Aeromonas veronii]